MSVLFHYITYRNQTLGRDYRVLKSSLEKHVLVKITRLLQGSLHLWISNSVYVCDLPVITLAGLRISVEDARLDLVWMVWNLDSITSHSYLTFSSCF